MGPGKWGRSILLALTVVFAAMLLLFAADYFCGASFGFWVVTFKTCGKGFLDDICPVPVLMLLYSQFHLRQLLPL